MSERIPTIFLSHGAPPLADDPIWPGQLNDWATQLPRPDAILIVSAHWEQRPITVSSTLGAPLIRDFWGFPQHYYTVPYACPAAPELAASVTRLLTESGHDVDTDQDRGLDHGAYVPLVAMYPQADIPVLQLSMPTLDPQALFAIGGQLAPLRDQNVLLIGSGFTTHNLRLAQPFGVGPAHPALTEFDLWAEAQVSSGNVDALLDFANQAPDPQIAHPRTEHWVPLHVVLGAAAETADVAGRTAIDGVWWGLSKRSWTFG